MIAESYEAFKEVNPAKKDAEWCNQVISLLRRDWRNMVDPYRMQLNKRILYSQQDMEHIKAMFKDKEFKKHTEFIPLGIWTRIINIIVEEITKNPPKMELRANDATALSDKKDDVLRMKYKGLHEKQVGSIMSKIGMPATSITEDKFKTNISGEFQRLGLDPNKPKDIEFFERNNYQRLKYEIAGQKLINIIIKLNRFDEETVRDFVVDILASLCICMQVYVDELTGEIKYDRIYPEEAFGIFGDKRDGSDDISKGYMKNLTIREWLGRVGNDFEFERDWRQLLWALNYCNGSKYTGFVRNGFNYDVTNSLDFHKEMGLVGAVRNNLDWTLAYTYKIYTGYIEFSSMEATAEYLKKVDTGEIVSSPANFDFLSRNKEERKKYDTESFYNEQIYKSYFLTTSSTSQWIYNWGKVYYQELYGAYDEFAKGTLIYYKMEGEPAATLSRFYIDLANLTAYRLKWFVYKAKPTEEEVIIPELVKVAQSIQRLYPQNAKGTTPNVENIINQLIQYQQENFVRLRDFPEIEGKTYPQLHPLHAQQRGVDPIALWMQTTEGWCERQIADTIIGLNDIRMGQLQNARQGYKQGQEETQASYNSTSYLFRMIQYAKERVCEATLNFTQDIIRFKDSIPYKWLLKLMGENEFENLKLLGDYASHRYGIIVENYNAIMERQRLLQAADRALDSGDGRGGISIVEWGIIIMDEDTKGAFMRLDYFRYKADEKKREQELQNMEIQKQDALEIKQAEDKMQQRKDKAALAKTQTEAKAQMYAADKQYAAKVDVKEMSNNHEPEKVAAKTESQQQIAEKKADLKDQESFA